jgi:hypothetical protein
MVPATNPANNNPVQANHNYNRSLIPAGNGICNNPGQQPVVPYNRSFVPSTNQYNNSFAQPLTPIEYASNPVAVRPPSGMSATKGGMFQPTFPTFDGLKHQVSYPTFHK